MVTQQFTGLSSCQLLSHGIDGHAEFAFRQDCAISRLMFRDVVAVVNQKLEADSPTKPATRACQLSYGRVHRLATEKTRIFLKPPVNDGKNGKIGKTLWRLPLRGSEVFS